MPAVLSLFLSLVSPEAAPPAAEIARTIERDHGTSADHVTLCRVRVVNYGNRSWSGRSIAFEARAIRGGAVAAVEHGRFGLTLAPYGTLETIVGFTGRFDGFEVSRTGKSAGERRPRASARARGKSRKSN